MAAGEPRIGIVGQYPAALDAKQAVEPLDDLRTARADEAELVDFLRLARIAANRDDRGLPVIVDDDLVRRRDRDRALRAANRLDASAVMVNDPTTFRTDWMPFAGRRVSGYGTGGIPYTMRDMTQEKMILLKRR